MDRLIVLAVDKVRDADVRTGCDRYQKRLARYHRFREAEVKPVKPQPNQETKAKDEEATRLLATLPAACTLVLCDEHGSEFTSREFADKLSGWLSLGKPVVFALGGALGHGAAMRERADAMLSLSRLTLPHELARLMLCEQLYRACTILAGEPYHND